MNSLEGYPRYVGMDFFGCRNAWVNPWRIRNTYSPFFSKRFFGIEEENLGSDFLKAIKSSLQPLLILIILISFIFSGKLQYVFSDLAPPVQLYSYLFCTFFPPSEWNLGPGLIAYDWGWDFELVLHKQNQSGLGHLPQLLGFPPSSMFSSILLGVFEECHQPERRQISLSAVLKSWLLLYDKLTDVYILEFFSIIQFPGNWLTFTLN